ncbi:MAG: hypothetical protein ACREMY_01900 [bacterium]
MVVTNTNGWELSVELAEWTKLELLWQRLGVDLSDELASNLEAGRGLWSRLRDTTHAGARADIEDEKRAVVWRKHGKKARRKLRRRLRHDGMPDPFDLPELDSSALTAWITEGAEPSWVSELDEEIGSQS